MRHFKRFFRTILISFVLLFLLQGIAAQTQVKADDGLADSPWPCFRHDARHTGLSEYVGTPVATLKWRFKMNGYIDSSPAIGSDGTIYVGSNAGSYDGYLYAISPDGTQKWCFETDGDIDSSPAIGSDGTIYVGSDDDYLYAISSNGYERWQFDCVWNVDSSPTIGSDGTIYVGSAGNDLYAINLDGTQKWRFDTNHDIDSSPAIGSDGTIYIGSGDEYLYAIDYSNGTYWRFDTGYQINSSPAIGSDGTIYVGCHKYLYALYSNGIQKWRCEIGCCIDSSPAIGSDGTIYVGSSDEYLYAINPDGTQEWQFKTNGDIDSSPAIDSDGTIYVGSYDGYLYAINPDGTEKWCYRTSDEIRSSPAIGSDGTIYVGSRDNYLYAIGIPNGKGMLYGSTSDYASTLHLANVIISTMDEETQSDNAGNYSLVLEPGVYDITFSKTDYQPITIYDVVIIEGEYTNLDVEIIPSGPLNLTTTDLTPSENGNDYNFQIRLSGGVYPYTFTLAYGFLPAGLSLDAQQGSISGTPEESGSFTFAVGVEDAEGSYAEREFSLEVAAILDITTDAKLPRGTKSTSYFKSIEASGGTEPYSFSKTDGSLPSGLSLASDGSISGTPSSSGSWQFTIQVMDDSGRTTEKSFQLEIVDALSIAISLLNDGITGQVYNQELSASGGYGSYVWEVYSGTLPSGLELDSYSGVLSGTPTEATYGTIVLSVEDAEDRITYQDFTLQVADPLNIETDSMPDGLIEGAYSEAIRTQGGVSPFSFSYEGQLPAGLSLDSSTGIISGTPTLAGLTNISFTVTDSTYPTSQADIQTLSIRISSQLTILTSAVLSNAKQNQVVNTLVLEAAGGPSPYTWQLISGSLPGGMSLNPDSGELSGTPDSSGDFVFSIQVTDTNGDTADKEFILHVSQTLCIDTGAIPDGAGDKPYSFTLEADGGILPYTWRIKSGTLPSGLSFNGSTGTISGIPTTRQTYSFTVEVNDSDNPAQTAEKTYIIEILDDLFICTPALPSGRTDEAYTATIEADLGVLPYTWNTSGVLPPGLTLNGSTNEAVLEGTPTEVGTYTFTVNVSDCGTPVHTSSQEYTVEIYGDVAIDTTGLACAVTGQPYSDSIVVSGGELPYSYSIVQGSLPDGLYLNSSSGHISGTTNLLTGVSSTFTVKVTDSGNPSGYDQKEFVIYVINPLNIVTETIQNAMQGYAYSASLEGEGGVSPYTWAVSSDELPGGLSLDADTGKISGTPTRSGTFSFTIKLQDSAPSPNTDTYAYNLEILGPAVCTGDSDGDGQVSIAEVQSAVNQFLGQSPVEDCNDENGDGQVSISELQTVANNFLQGC